MGVACIGCILGGRKRHELQVWMFERERNKQGRPALAGLAGEEMDKTKN